MSFNLCLLHHLKISTYAKGQRAEYKCDAEGIEIGEPTIIEGDTDVNRWYICTNCGRRFKGNETFDEARQHLGKENTLVDPFT